MKEFSMVVVLDDFSVAESAGMKVERMVDWKVGRTVWYMVATMVVWWEFVVADYWDICSVVSMDKLTEK